MDPKFRDILRTLADTVVGAGQGASAGFMDELAGITNMMSEPTGERAAGRGLNAPVFTEDAERGARYEEGRDSMRETQDQASENSPVASTVGQVLGSIPAAIALGSTGLGVPGAGAVQGAANGLGANESGDAQAMFEDTMGGAQVGLLSGVAGEVGGAAARGIATRAQPALRSMADSGRAAVAGLIPAEISEYLATGQLGQVANTIRNAGVPANATQGASRAAQAAGPLPEAPPMPPTTGRPMQPPIDMPVDPPLPLPRVPDLAPNVPVQSPPSGLRANPPSQRGLGGRMESAFEEPIQSTGLSRELPGGAAPGAPNGQGQPLPAPQSPFSTSGLFPDLPPPRPPGPAIPPLPGARPPAMPEAATPSTPYMPPSGPIPMAGLDEAGLLRLVSQRLTQAAGTEAARSPGVGTLTSAMAMRSPSMGGRALVEMATGTPRPVVRTNLAEAGASAAESVMSPGASQGAVLSAAPRAAATSVPDRESAGMPYKVTDPKQISDDELDALLGGSGEISDEELDELLR